MHYGHPDVFDRLFHITRGGISKASRVINISEDIFVGNQFAPELSTACMLFVHLHYTASRLEAFSHKWISPGVMNVAIAYRFICFFSAANILILNLRLLVWTASRTFVHFYKTFNQLHVSSVFNYDCYVNLYESFS